MRKHRKKFIEKNVKDSFIYMLHVLERKWNNGVTFSKLKKACGRDDRLSDELKYKALSTRNVGELLNILANTPFCNWMKIEILKCMAWVAEVPEAKSIIKIYEECTYNRKCSEVMIHIMHIIKRYFNDEDAHKVIDKLKESPDMTVKELIDYHHELEEVF